MLKKILIGFVVIVALAAVGGFFLSANMDSIVRTAIEKYGTAATQTAVKLERVKIVLASGEAALGGLSVGNPAGFAAPQSLYLGKIAVKIDTSSLAGTGPIVIQDIDIEEPQITYEVDNKGATNLQAIARNAQTYANSFGGGKEKATTKASEGGKQQPGRKIVILNLTVREGQVSISQALLQGKSLSAKLPVLHLTNIGKDEGGATPAAVAQEVLDAITASASKVASASLTKELGASLKKAGSGLVGKTDAGSIGNQLKGLLGK